MEEKKKKNEKEKEEGRAKGEEDNSEVAPSNGEVRHRQPKG